MTSIVLEINERKSLGKSLIEYLKLLGKTNDYVSNVNILSQKSEKRVSGIEAAIEDIKMGRVTTYENYDEYEKDTNKMLGYV
jgi:hypothetical protein